MRALAISGGILIGVFVLIIIVTFVTVHRGEVQMEDDSKQHGHGATH